MYKLMHSIVGHLDDFDTIDDAVRAVLENWHECAGEEDAYCGVYSVEFHSGRAVACIMGAGDNDVVRVLIGRELTSYLVVNTEAGQTIEVI